MTVLDRPRPSAAPQRSAPPRSAPGRRGTSTAGSAWIDAAAILVAVGAVAAPVCGFFATSSWLLVGLALAAVVLVTGTIARVVARRRWVPVAIAVASTAAIATAALTPGEGFLLVVPTPWSFQALDDRIAVAIQQLAVGAAPMAETGETLAALAGAVLLIALLVFALVGVGVPALAGPVLLVLWIVPGVVNGTDVDLLAFLVAGAAWLVLLTGAGHQLVPGARSRRLRVPAVAAGVAALLLASLAAPLAPRTEPLSGPGSVSGFLDATGIDQTIALGEQLRGGGSTVMLRYRSDDPQYLRVLTLTDFTGRRWVADPADRLDTPPPDLVVPGPGQTAVTTSVEIAALRTRSLPIPIGTAAVDGLPAGWRWNAGLATVSSEREDTGGLEYTATALVSPPDRAALAVAWAAADGAARVPLDLPERTPTSIIDTAVEVTAGAADDYDRALALQAWLREGGGFAYSVNAPVNEGFDGSGLDAIEAFLEVREGYCVHFASAMAVMARTLGIPSRIAIGFAPGDATSAQDGLTEWAVTGDDLHAWPELWFDEVGWLPFEPTPGLGLAAADPVEDAEEAAEDEAPAAPTTAPTSAPSLAPEDEADPGALGPGAAAPSTVAGGLLVALAAMLVVLSVPALVRTAVRASRRRRGAEGRWRELVATAVDLGLELDEDATPRALARSLAAAAPEATSAIETLRDAVEAARFGPPGSAPHDPAGAAALPTAVGALRAHATTGRRALATLAPRSLARAARSRIRAVATRYAGAS